MPSLQPEDLEELLRRVRWHLRLCWLSCLAVLVLTLLALILYTPPR